MREHAGEEGGELRNGDVGKDGPDDSEITDKGNKRPNQAHLRALANPDPVQQSQQHQHADGDR